MSDHVAKTLLFEQFARVAKALGHPGRLQLVDLLSQGERTVEALARVAGLKVSTTSAHLQVLRQAGLVSTRRAGTRVYYALTGEDVAELFVRVREVAQARIAETDVARRGYLNVPTEPSESSELYDEEISREELLARAESGELLVLDVRPSEEYTQGHIPGALCIPVEELAERIAELPADRTVVAYCRGRYCVFAYDAVRHLRANGYRALRLTDGMLEWRLAGLPVAA